MGTKQKKGGMTDLDRISKLPNELREKVLVRLPIKEAVKTSCLSSKWRYAWTYIPDLVFNTANVSLTGNPVARAPKLTKLVDIVLLLHQGPIQKFTLEYDHHRLKDAIHRWMVILSRNGIRKLDINLCIDSKWKMPSSFFTASSLTDVRLENCVLKLPRSFNGFELLKFLQLCGCSISDKDLENLISSCSHLESLVLLDMVGLFLTIRAPKLKHICLSMSDLKHIHLITPILVEAAFDVDFTVERNSCEKVLKDAFGSLCNIERLLIGGFTEFLAASGNMELLVKFTCLKELVLAVDPFNQKENAFAVFMFQNAAPSLETLEIVAERVSSPTETIWEPTMPTTLFLNLKLVKICYDQEYIAEFILPLVKLILATSPVLVSLHLAGPGADDNAVSLRKLLSFKRASKEAQIFVDSIPINSLS